MRIVKETPASLARNLEDSKRRLAVAIPGTQAFDILQSAVAAIEKRFHASCTDRMEAFLEREGSSDWWQLALLNYPLSNDGRLWRVTSIARTRDDAMFWEFDHKYEAIEKIQKLVGWLNDGRNRGFGDREADVERLTRIANTVSALSAAFLNMEAAGVFA
jgi:hypothetical protein